MSDPLAQQYIRVVSSYVAARSQWGAVSQAEDEATLAKEARRALNDSPEEYIQVLAGAYLDALDVLVDSTSEIVEHARAVRGYYLLLQSRKPPARLRRCMRGKTMCHHAHTHTVGLCQPA